MKQSEVYFLGLPSTVLEVARLAALQAFPGSRIIIIDHLEDAPPRPHADGAQLLVLADVATVVTASKATDVAGSPRWAVVVLGRDSPELAETVAPEDWNAPLLARVFRSAVLQHELLTENLRLQGDLRTVARRVSHDLRTPVGCIHTTSDVLAVDPDSVGMMADIIKQSSGEISQIIDRVAFVLKATTDPVLPAPLTMGEVVTATLQQLQPEITRSAAVVSQPASWPEVTAVAPWLQVVWWNLLRNALQHGGPFPQVQLAWIKEDGAYHFSVTDSGPGVPASRQASLFTRFDQLHGRQTPGLGLSIAQRLVALQGGHCRHETPAEGTRFTFTLPIQASS